MTPDLKDALATIQAFIDSEIHMRSSSYIDSPACQFPSSPQTSLDTPGAIP